MPFRGAGRRGSPAPPSWSSRRRWSRPGTRWTCAPAAAKFGKRAASILPSGPVSASAGNSSNTSSTTGGAIPGGRGGTVAAGGRANHAGRHHEQHYERACTHARTLGQAAAIPSGADGARHAVAARALGVVHRVVGPAQQLVGSRDLLSVAERRHADAERAPSDPVQGSSASRSDASSRRLSATCIASSGPRAGGAPRTRRRPAAPPRPSCAAGREGPPSREITASPTGVAERVVDVLEVVHVQQEHRAAARRGCAAWPSSRSSSCSKRRRLNTPLRASWSARCCSCSAARLRASMSTTCESR